MDKTNAMRILDSKKIEYVAHYYDDSIVDGVSVALAMGQDETKVFKTLVTVGNNLAHYVFVVPVGSTLDLKKASKLVGVKSVDMIKQRELLPLTGYIHGGCSPIGLKKPFVTIVDISAEGKDKICISAGRVGAQVELAPLALVSLVRGSFGDLTVSN